MKLFFYLTQFLTDFFLESGSDPDFLADPDPDLGKKVRSGSRQKDLDPEHCFTHIVKHAD